MRSICIICIFLVTFSHAQDSTDQTGLSWYFFVDTYYSYDFNNPPNHQKPSFLYNHNRHNEFNINLALVKFSHTNKKWRGSVGLMGGSYPESNLAAEPALLRHIYEASIGIKVIEKRDIWIDAGILPSHIGFETAISKDCWTLTRSILAENSPYYEAGIKGSYTTKNKQWLLAILLLNGWQRIKRPDGNNTLAFGTQINYTPLSKLSVNSSSFIGNDKTDSVRLMRYFHNLYSIIQITNKLGITLGFDAGMEQKTKGSSQMNFWYSPVFIIRYQWKDAWAYAMRIEYYSDPGAVIITPVSSKGVQLKGVSFNLDRTIGQNLLWRFEARLLMNNNPYFIVQNSLSKYQQSITTSLSIDF